MKRKKPFVCDRCKNDYVQITKADLTEAINKTNSIARGAVTTMPKYLIMRVWEHLTGDHTHGNDRDISV